MFTLHDKNATNRPTNFSVNSDLLKNAKGLDIRLLVTRKQALLGQLKAEQSQLWLQQNQKSIAAYNKSVTKMGVFSDGNRSF